MFEIGEFRPRKPAAEAARLAQLGHLSDGELAELRADARSVRGWAYKPLNKLVDAALAGEWEYKPAKPSADEQMWTCR
jgi:hypothetical protein